MGINFLPWREHIFLRKQRVFLSIFLSILVFSVVIWCASIVYVSHHHQKAARYHQQLSEQVQSLQKGHLFSQETEEKREKHPLFNWILEVSRKQKNIPKFLSDLASIEYQNFYLTHIAFEKEQIYLKGIALSISEVFRFIRQLKQLSVVAEVHFLSAGKMPKKTKSGDKDKEVKTFAVRVILK